MNDAIIRFAGAELIATTSGALLWPEYQAIIVADLHLEKASSFAKRGIFLPPYDTSATLNCLAALFDRFQPRTVICLGDSFHDQEGAQRLSADDRRRLAGLSQARDWIWVAGNHDPAIHSLSVGRTVKEVVIGGLTFRHQTRPGAVTAEVSGHLHPKASLTIVGKKLTGRCFVTDHQRLIMPAFGAYAGGLEVEDTAFTSLLCAKHTIYLLGRTKVHALPRVR